MTDPLIWGKSAWDFLYNVAYVFDGLEESKYQYKTFFMSLKHVLPCRLCRDNFHKHMEELPIDNYLETNKTLIMWLTKIQNKIYMENKRHKVASFTKIYDKLVKQQCPTFLQDLFNYYVIYKNIIIILFIIYFIYKYIHLLPKILKKK